MNAARPLVVQPDGTVYALPLRSNWPLLALCQVILALPLIFTRFALRCLQKQRLRLSSVTLMDD